MMPTSIEKRRILPISKSPEMIEDVRKAIGEQPDLLLLDPIADGKDLIYEIATLAPDVILLDFEYQKHGIFELVDKIANDFQGSALIVSLPESEITNSERIILSGARAFLISPIKKENLLRTVRRVMELMTRNQVIPRGIEEDTGARPKNTFTVFSPKGGAGTSTVAINLAIALHQTLHEDVLIIDGKHLFGHVALCLNIRTGNSITDLLSHIGQLDPHLVKQVAVRHISGVYVLPSPDSISEAQGIRPDDIYKMLQMLQGVFPNIVIDGGSYLSDNTVTYMDSSDRILLVLNPDLASLRDARQFIEITKSLSYPPEKTLLILNLTGRKADVKREEIENILKMKLFGRIPADENLALSSLNEGVPIILKNPHHPISNAIKDIAKGLEKIILQLKADYIQRSKSASIDALSKSSKLG
jgi:pilus assembly protein CpaE